MDSPAITLITKSDRSAAELAIMYRQLAGTARDPEIHLLLLQLATEYENATPDLDTSSLPDHADTSRVGLYSP
jgi:hypothetical protein